MPLGTEVGPGDIVLDGRPHSPQKGGTAPPPRFWPMYVVATQLDGLR